MSETGDMLTTSVLANGFGGFVEKVVFGSWALWGVWYRVLRLSASFGERTFFGGRVFVGAKSQCFGDSLRRQATN